MSIRKFLYQERRNEIQIAITTRKVDTARPYISGSDAQAVRDLPLDIEIPLQFVRLWRIALHVIAGAGIGRQQRQNLIGKAGRRWFHDSRIQVKRNRMIEI